MIYFFRPKDKNGYLSNWYPSKFVLDGQTYTCMEQYMMHQKAVLFGDNESAEKILAEDAPKKIMALGRKVKPFDPVIWSGLAQIIVYKGLVAKFEQNKKLKERLLSTGDEILVEASPYDATWGIKLGKTHPNAKDPSTWEGKNLLGFALMQARETLKKDLE